MLTEWDSSVWQVDRVIFINKELHHGKEQNNGGRTDLITWMILDWLTEAQPFKGQLSNSFFCNYLLEQTSLKMVCYWSPG